MEYSNGNRRVERDDVFTSAIYLVPGLFVAPPCGSGIRFSMIEQPEWNLAKSSLELRYGDSSPALKLFSIRYGLAANIELHSNRTITI